MRPTRFLLAGISASIGLLLALPLIVAGLPFWTISALTRLLRPLTERLGGRPVQWQQIVQFEPVVGWKPRPNLHIRASGELGSVYELTTDREGWRGRLAIEDSQVVVFGDSFAFGHSADERTFFGHLDPRVRIKAIGADGYNMVQELTWMERLSTKLRGKLVVWFVFYGNDLYENLLPNHAHYRMPFARSRNGTGAWEIVTSHVTDEPWFASVRPSFGMALAEICSDTPGARRVWEACEYLITLGRDVCRRAGAELVILGIPSVRQISAGGRAGLAAVSPQPDRFAADVPDRRLTAICRQLGVSFVPLSKRLTHADYAGTHWNARGHRRVADLIVDLWSSHERTRAAAGAALPSPATAPPQEVRVRSKPARLA